MKKIICLILVGLIVLVGCTTTTTTPPFEFENTGSNIENYKICYEHTKELCDKNFGCNINRIDLGLDDIICDDDRCMC